MRTHEITMDTSGFKVSSSSQEHEWYVDDPYGFRVAVFKCKSDAYMWKDIMNGRYELKRRDD